MNHVTLVQASSLLKHLYLHLQRVFLQMLPRYQPSSHLSITSYMVQLAVPSASTQYTAYTVPHTHGYGVSGAVPNSPHYATSPPNLFSDNLHPQSAYHHRSMQRAQSAEPSIVPKCEKSDLTQPHRRTSCTSDSAAGNMQQNERLVSESSEDRSAPRAEYRQQQAQQNKLFQQESTSGTTYNTCSSGKVCHATKIIKGNSVSIPFKKKKNYSIPVRCVLPACPPYVFRWSSLGVTTGWR